MYFNPTSAPAIHIENLPSNTVAVEVHSGEAKSFSYPMTLVPNAVHISIWAPRGSGLATVSSQSDEEFFETHCTECDFHTDVLEVDMGGRGFVVDYNDAEVELYGYANAHSPCPCYDNGIAEVSFPCAMGYEIEDDTEPSDRTLRSDYLSYTITRNPETFKYMCGYARQQAIIFGDDGTTYLSDEDRAINCYDTDRICWGSNREPTDLLNIEMVYTASKANEDLLEFNSHEYNAEGIDSEIEDGIDGLREDPAAVRLKFEGRALGLAVATPQCSTEAFMVLAASGCRIDQGIASVPVQRYRNVAVDDDTVLDVWVTDPLPIGQRLMFLQHPDGDMCLGQIPLDFNLTPCELTQQPSSAAAGPGSSSFLASCAS